jgi:amino acid adenylation domain-containing protein
MTEPAEPATTGTADTGLIHRMLERAAAAHPDTLAVSDPEGAWTYAELAAAAGSWADWLADQGVLPGERVLARLDNTRHFVALLFGASRAGAVFVPIGITMKGFHLARVLEDCEPVLVIGSGDDTRLLRDLASVPVHDVDAIRDKVYAAPPAIRSEVPLSPDDLALLMYTSGSTSMPKAVMSPHRAVVFATGAIAERLGYRADDVVLNAIPFPFDYGLYQIFLSVTAGAALVLSSTESHVGLMAMLSEHRVTVVPLVPSLAAVLLRLAARDRREPPGVRLFTNTGAALVPAVIDELRKAFPSAAVAPMYGTTECKRITVLEPGLDQDYPGSVGPALTGTEVLILADDGTPLPTGETGEIVVRGPHVMDGYWRSPELTAERFRRDPATGQVTLHTGDFGHLDADGHLYVQGRRDDLFKRHGVRMSALEIEAAAVDVPRVRAAGLLPPTGEGGLADMVLFVAGDITVPEVLTALADRLEPAKVPLVCHVLPELPLTANGKIDKKRLLEWAAKPAS